MDGACSVLGPAMGHRVEGIVATDAGGPCSAADPGDVEQTHRACECEAGQVRITTVAVDALEDWNTSASAPRGWMRQILRSVSIRWFRRGAVLPRGAW